MVSSLRLLLVGSKHMIKDDNKVLAPTNGLEYIYIYMSLLAK
jgi:hypothetical protein